MLFLFPNSFLIFKNLAASSANGVLKIILKEKPVTMFLKKSINLIFEKLLTRINHLTVIKKGRNKKNRYTINISTILTFVKIDKKFFWLINLKNK